MEIETTETTATETTLAKWTAEGAGPIQVGRVNEALAKLRWMRGQYTELTGVHGRPETERRCTLTEMFSTRTRDDVAAAELAVQRRFGAVVTKANAAALAAAILAELPGLRAGTPVVDKRITAEEFDATEARLQASRDRDTTQRAAEKASHDAIAAKRPAGAYALIIAELEVDKCDLQSDYFATATTRRVAIGWRYGAREDFAQLRRAALNFPETADLGPDAPADIEHRDNYSMGAGNYLKVGGRYSTGWRIISRVGTYGAIEDGLPAPAPAPTGWDKVDGGPASPLLVEVGGQGVAVIRPSTQKDGYVEVVFQAKPDESIRTELKAAGFRWAKHNACWYGPAARLPARYR